MHLNEQSLSIFIYLGKRKKLGEFDMVFLVL